MQRLPREPRDLTRAYAALADYGRSRQWARASLRVARQVIEPGVHRAVITCGPPHFVHLAGRRLAREMRLPWIMDLRDPWSLIQRLPEALASPVWLWLAAWHERRAVRDADLVVANTNALRNAMRGAYPAAAHRIIAVPNGHDDDAVPSAPAEPRFLLIHAGSIYLDRDPRPLLRAAAKVIAARGLAPASFGIEFLGSMEGHDRRPLRAIADEEGVGAYVSVYPPVSRQEALRRLARAAMLTVLPQDSDMAVPAKLYDYMQFDAWILAFADPGSAVAVLLQGSGADVVRADDVAACAAVIDQRFEQFTRGERAVRLATNPAYSRRAQADILFNAMARIADLPTITAPEGDPACVAS
jgi:glycosyltransferase involved in cell wall biosynthesis